MAVPKLRRRIDSSDGDVVSEDNGDDEDEVDEADTDDANRSLSERSEPLALDGLRRTTCPNSAVVGGASTGLLTTGMVVGMIGESVDESPPSGNDLRENTCRRMEFRSGATV